MTFSENMASVNALILGTHGLLQLATPRYRAVLHPDYDKDLCRVLTDYIGATQRSEAPVHDLVCGASKARSSQVGSRNSFSHSCDSFMLLVEAFCHAPQFTEDLVAFLQPLPQDYAIAAASEDDYDICLDVESGACWLYQIDTLSGDRFVDVGEDATPSMGPLGHQVYAVHRITLKLLHCAPPAGELGPRTVAVPANTMTGDHLLRPRGNTFGKIVLLVCRQSAARRTLDLKVIGFARHWEHGDEVPPTIWHCRERSRVKLSSRATMLLVLLHQSAVPCVATTWAQSWHLDAVALPNSRVLIATDHDDDHILGTLTVV